MPKDKSLQTSNATLMRELRSENLKLHKQLAKCQAQGISYKNRIAALEAEIKKRPNLAELIAKSGR